MYQRKISLLHDGIHFRITLPNDFVEDKGWKKGDKLSVINNPENIKIKKIKKRSEHVLYSIGYEGKSLDEFIKLLKRNKVEHLIDVREIPQSRKPGFSKRSLKTALEKKNITYNNLKELGTDKRSRDEYKRTGDIEKLLVKYDKRMSEQLEIFELLKAMIFYKTTAIMCYEDNYKQCHRQRIESIIEKNGIRVVHICNGKEKRS